MNAAETSTIIAAFIGVLGVIASAFIGAIFGQRAAQKNADANIQDAYSKAQDIQSKNWERLTDAMQKRNEALAEQIDTNSKRITDSEIRSSAAELKAAKAEALFTVAIAYLRRLAAWFTTNWPDVEMPQPPPELETHL